MSSRRLRPWVSKLLMLLAGASLLGCLLGACAFAIWGYGRFGFLPDPRNGNTILPMWLTGSLLLALGGLVFLHLSALHNLSGRRMFRWLYCRAVSLKNGDAADQAWGVFLFLIVLACWPVIFAVFGLFLLAALFTELVGESRFWPALKACFTEPAPCHPS